MTHNSVDVLLAPVKEQMLKCDTKNISTENISKWKLDKIIGKKTIDLHVFYW